MLKILVKPVFVAFLMSLSSPASANGYIESIEQCLAAHQSGDKGKVKLIASEISSIKMYGDQTRIDAAKCMSHAYGGEWVYDHSAKAMIIKNKIITELSDEKENESTLQEENIRKKIDQIILDQPNLSSNDKAYLLNEIYISIASNKDIDFGYRMTFLSLFMSFFEVPSPVIDDIGSIILRFVPLDETTIDKLSVSIPNSSILTFRKFIEGNKNLIPDISLRRRAIENIDKAILSKTNTRIKAYGSETDAEGSPKAISILYAPLTVATNIDTDIKFEGRINIPAGISPNEFNDLFSWRYNNQKAKTVVVGKEIKWTKTYKIQKKNKENYVDFNKFFSISFGTAQETVKFKAKRKLYHPIIYGVGFNLVELEYPTLSECIKAIKNGIKLSNQDIFFEKAIYKFDVGKFPWKGEQQFFQCERYGISDDETVFYTQSRMLPE